jgi:PAS domain S-box-containing protein
MSSEFHCLHYMTKVSPLAPAPVNQLRERTLSNSPSRRPNGSDHFVQFYEHDEFLVTSVAKYIREGLESGADALIVATANHLDGIARQLESANLHVSAFERSRRYVALDAAELLRKILIDGVPNSALFEQHVGSLVARHTADGRRLRIFGEMVALLCADGHHDSALQLETLWNSLAEQHAFSLFCAYPMTDFARNSASGPFLHVCQAHARVLPTEEYLGAELTSDERLRTIATLQQKAASLEAEVAARKHAEDVLRRRDVELTNLVEAASLGLHWVDQNGTILWANKAELELVGFEASEYVGRNIADFHVDQLLIAELLASLRRGENVRDRESRVRCKDGSIKTVLIDSNVLWEDGRFVHTQCFTRDITEQRRAEMSSRHLAAIVEGSDDAIVSKNLDGVITSWNNGATRIFGYEPHEVIGKPVTVLIPHDRLNEETEILARLRRGERVDHFETIRRCKDGSLLDVSLTISPVREGSGKIVGASKIARDISGKKRADEALERAREELARTNEELEKRVHDRTESLREAIAQLEEFSYTVSHDLRAPLRGMQVYSQALLEDYGPTLDHEAQHCLSRIADNATRLDKMVLDVLTFSRISRADLRMERVRLDPLVREIIQHYPAMQPPRATIEVAHLHDVFGHEPSLTQVVSNLLGNAVKFVAPGVTPLVRVWTEINADGVRLFVRDNGIGIKPERQSRLFRMFERLHPDMPYEGTGVGLAIVRKAATRMGGNVGVISEEGSGTTFWVQLPATEGTG